jgi:hypothetical protein
MNTAPGRPLRRAGREPREAVYRARERANGGRLKMWRRGPKAQSRAFFEYRGCGGLEVSEVYTGVDLQLFALSWASVG